MTWVSSPRSLWSLDLAHLMGGSPLCCWWYRFSSCVLRGSYCLWKCLYGHFVVSPRPLTISYFPSLGILSYFFYFFSLHFFCFYRFRYRTQTSVTVAGYCPQNMKPPVETVSAGQPESGAARGCLLTSLISTETSVNYFFFFSFFRFRSTKLAGGFSNERLPWCVWVPWQPGLWYDECGQQWLLRNQHLRLLTGQRFQVGFAYR